MNTHRIWLQQLQDKYNKRVEDGNLTEDEIVRKQFESKSIHEAIQEVSEPQQLDELPILAPLAMGAAKMAGGAIARAGVKKLAMKGAKVVGKAAVQSALGPKQESIEQSEEDALLEEIAYLMIETLEEQIGRRLTPEEIEEFVENNYDDILEEANNQVTAHAIEGDKNKGVGADAPEQPSSKPLPPLKAGKGAKGTGPKRVGSEGY